MDNIEIPKKTLCSTEPLIEIVYTERDKNVSHKDVNYEQINFDSKLMKNILRPSCRLSHYGYCFISQEMLACFTLLTHSLDYIHYVNWVFFLSFFVSVYLRLTLLGFFLSLHLRYFYEQESKYLKAIGTLCQLDEWKQREGIWWPMRHREKCLYYREILEY